LNINCILVLKHPDDGHNSDQNMLEKNMWLNILINVHLLVYHIKHSLMHTHGTQKVHEHNCELCTNNTHQYYYFRKCTTSFVISPFYCWIL